MPRRGIAPTIVTVYGFPNGGKAQDRVGNKKSIVAIYRFYEPAFSSMLVAQFEELKAFSEASVGWTIDRVKVKFPDGLELPMCQPRIFHKEEDGWKIVHNHISILMPNEKLEELQF